MAQNDTQVSEILRQIAPSLNELFAAATNTPKKTGMMRETF